MTQRQQGTQLHHAMTTSKKHYQYQSHHIMPKCAVLSITIITYSDTYVYIVLFMRCTDGYPLKLCYFKWKYDNAEI